MRGLLLEPLAGEDGSSARTILAPHLFDRNANEVEVMRPADPFDAVPAPVVELLQQPRVIDRGSNAYLQILLESPENGEQAADGGLAPAAANDELALAAGSHS